MYQGVGNGSVSEVLLTHQMNDRYINKLVAWNKRDIREISDCDGIQTHDHSLVKEHSTIHISVFIVNFQNMLQISTVYWKVA